MQDPQIDIDNCRRLGVDLKFRPSPNFKNMKKFFKSKTDYAESSSPPNGNAEQVKPNAYSASPLRNNEHIDQSPVRPIQPPLPLEPPPPDSPPIIPIPLKEEIIDEEYEKNGQESPQLSLEEEDPPQNCSPELRNNEEPEKTSNRPKPTICRDFIRGMCSRGGSCKYAHECDLSQLVGVYTFCRNFQNVVCKYPQCRYVHASVFEEQEFYRTGYLPEHALKHLKKPAYVLPPPPPPPPPEEAPAEIAMMPHTSPPPPPPPPPNAIPSIPNLHNIIASPQKRDWSTVEAFSNLQRDLAIKEHSAKKCKNCDTMEIRLTYNKEKMESMQRSSDELKIKTGLLNKKTHNLYSVLFTIIKTQATNNGGLSGLAATLNMCGEKEKAVLQNVLENAHFNNMIT